MASSLFTSLKNRGFAWSLRLLIFSLPFNVGVLIYESPWGRGFTNPYTSIFLSAFDILLLITLVFFLFRPKKKSLLLHNDRNFLILLAAIAISCLSQLWALHQDANFSLLLCVKLLELLAFYAALHHSSKPQKILYVFILTMCIQSMFALWQFTAQHDLGLQMLGESQFSSTVANVARFQLGSIDLIRAYGTFPHPNILGGFLLVSILCTFTLPANFKGEKYALIALQVLALLTTFSRSALLALLIVFALMPGKKKYWKLLPLALGAGLIFALRGAVFERLEGYEFAYSILQNQPLGLGFAQFTTAMDSVSTVALMPWDYQPVHNIYLLLLTEWGIPAFLIFTVLTVLNFKKPKFSQAFLKLALIGLLITGLFDHYLVSLEQGRLLLVFVFALQALKTGGFLNKTSADPK